MVVGSWQLAALLLTIDLQMREYGLPTELGVIEMSHYDQILEQALAFPPILAGLKRRQELICR